MYQDPIQLRNKRIAILAGAVVAIIFIIIIISTIVNFVQSRERVIFIKDFSTCASGIPGDTEQTAKRNFYDYVEAQLKLAGRESEIATNYEGVVRADSCELDSFVDEKNHTGYNASFILDIESLGLSYGAVLSYVKSGEPALVDVDLGTPSLLCLEKKDLIYGEFDCKDNPLIQIGTDATFRSAETFFPYSDGEHFLVDLIDDSKLTLIFTPSEEVYLNGEVGEFYKKYLAEIESYLKSKGYDIKDFELIEKWK